MTHRIFRPSTACTNYSFGLGDRHRLGQNAAGMLVYARHLSKAAAVASRRRKAHCKKVTSSTKPELHNISQCRHRRTDPWPQATCTENLVKFGPVVL